MNDLVWHPKYVTFIVNGIEYKDYKTPIIIELNIIDFCKKKKKMLGCK